LPQFDNGNTPLLRIYFLKGYNRASNYDLIPTDGLTVQAALWSGSTLLAAQYTWTAYDGEYFEASLALNTAEIETFLASESSKVATFQIDYLRAGVPTTVLLKPVRIYQTGIDLDSIVPVATPTPLSAEAADAAYVRANVHWGAIYLGDPANPTAPLIKLWNDNGVGKLDPES
jgi:hypothetical protein